MLFVWEKHGFWVKMVRWTTDMRGTEDAQRLAPPCGDQTASVWSQNQHWTWQWWAVVDGVYICWWAYSYLTDLIPFCQLGRAVFPEPNNFSCFGLSLVAVGQIRCDRDMQKPPDAFILLSLLFPLYKREQMPCDQLRLRLPGRK